MTLLAENGYNNEQINAFIGEKQESIRFFLFKMKTFAYENEYKLQTRFSIGIEFNEKQEESKLVSLGGAHVYTNEGKSCVFNGVVFYSLISENSFYYNFYGDIYKQGNFNNEIGPVVNIGSDYAINNKVSEPDKAIKNISEAESYTFLKLKP